MYEDLGLGSQYGAFTGTAQQNIGLIENLGYKGGTTPAVAGGESNLAGSKAVAPSSAGTTSISLSGLSPLQQQYAQTFASMPSEGALYEKYAGELGIPETEKIIGGLSQSIMSLEDKIGKVEGDVNTRMGEFQVTEAQRRRLQNVEEQPLRTQYLEAVRQKSYQEAGLASKQNLLATRMKYATEEAQRPLELMKTMIDWEQANKENTSLMSGFAELFKAVNENKPAAVKVALDTSLTQGAVPITETTQKALTPLQTAGITKKVESRKPVWQMTTSELTKSLTGGK
jgi:hypothetical protein